MVRPRETPSGITMASPAPITAPTPNTDVDLIVYLSTSRLSSLAGNLLAALSESLEHLLSSAHLGIPGIVEATGLVAGIARAGRPKT